MATHIAALYVVLYPSSPPLTHKNENAASLPMLFITTIRDVLIVILSSFFWQNRVPIFEESVDKQLDFLQLGGYCTALSALYLFKKGKPLGLHNVSPYLLIVTILFSTSTLPQVPHLNLPGSTLPTPQHEVLYESSWSQLGSTPWSQPDSLSLSGFLQSRGVSNDKTLFVTIASKKYVAPMINFKFGLDRWDLGKQYVILCLDHECVQAAESQNIHAYTGYLMSAKEEGDDWHTPVARIKVFQTSTDLTRCSSPRISTSLIMGTISSCWTETYTSQVHGTHYQECAL